MRFEYKVISTLQEGCPLSGEERLPWFKRLELGLNELGKQGWLVVDISSNLIVLARLKR